MCWYSVESIKAQNKCFPRTELFKTVICDAMEAPQFTSVHYEFLLYFGPPHQKKEANFLVVDRISVTLIFVVSHQLRFWLLSSSILLKIYYFEFMHIDCEPGVGACDWMNTKTCQYWNKLQWQFPKGWQIIWCMSTFGYQHFFLFVCHHTKLTVCEREKVFGFHSLGENWINRGKKFFLLQLRSILEYHFLWSEPQPLWSWGFLGISGISAYSSKLPSLAVNSNLNPQMKFPGWKARNNIDSLPLLSLTMHPTNK